MNMSELADAIIVSVSIGTVAGTVIGFVFGALRALLVRRYPWLEDKR